MIENELIFDLPFEEYLAVDAVSSTGLAHMRRSPFHFNFFTQNKQVQTDAMAFGHLLHCAVLEPERFQAQYFGVPETMPLPDGGTKKIDMRFKDCKEFVAKLEAENAGRTLVKPQDFAKLQGIKQRIWTSDAAWKWIAQAKTEVSLFWTDEATGLKCKARFDALTPDGYILDLKKTTSVKPRAWEWKVWEMRYYGQAAWYYDALSRVRETKGFRWLAVMDEAPFDYGRFSAHPLLLEAGSQENGKLLRKIAECRTLGQWPYPDDEHVTVLPDAVLGELAD